MLCDVFYQAVQCIMEPYSLEYIRKRARAQLMTYRDLSLPCNSFLHQFTSMHFTNLKLGAPTNQNGVVQSQLYQCILFSF